MQPHRARGADGELPWLHGLADPVHLDDDDAFAADVGQVDEHQRSSLDRAQSRRLSCELSSVEEDHRFADGQFLGYLTDRCQGGRWQPSSRSSVTGSQCQSAIRDLAVGRLDDLGGFPDCLVPDSGVRVGEGPFGGVEPGGDQEAAARWRQRRPSAGRRWRMGRTLSSITSLGEGVLDFLEELRQPGRRDLGDRLAQSRGATGRAWGSTARHPRGAQQSSQPASSHVQQQNKPCHASGPSLATRAAHAR